MMNQPNNRISLSPEELANLSRRTLNVPVQDNIPPQDLRGTPGMETQSIEGKGAVPQMTAQELLLQTLFGRIIRAIEAMVPRASCIVEGAPSIVDTGPHEYVFTVDRARVQALRVLVANNTSNTIYYDFDQPASSASIPLAAGSSVTLAAPVAHLSICCPTAGTVAVNPNGVASTDSIAIRGWSNPAEETTILGG